MPTFDYKCDCGHAFVDLSDPDGTTTCPACSAKVSPQFSPTTALRLASWCRADAEEYRARQQAWMQSDEFKQGIKDGTIVPEDHARSESYDGVAASSSIQDRAEAGLRITPQTDEEIKWAAGLHPRQLQTRAARAARATNLARAKGKIIDKGTMETHACSFGDGKGFLVRSDGKGNTEPV